MADTNGKDNTQRRLDQLEDMDRLLLRAQVLQADSIENLQKWTKQTEKWMADADARHRHLDERINALVSAIGDLISRIPPSNLR